MIITEKQRVQIETAIDSALMFAADYNALRKAVAIVRERPQGARKVRADAGTKRRLK